MTFLARWFRRNTHNPAARPSGTGPAIAQRRCSLHLESLEDRTLLSAGFHDFGRGGFAAGFAFAARGYEYENASTSGPAAHLEVIVPENVTAGNAFNVTVEAEDASNHLATGYTGTIHFSLGSTDAGATLPADYTFTASDHGKHTFQVTLSATPSSVNFFAHSSPVALSGAPTTQRNWNVEPEVCRGSVGARPLTKS